MFQRNETNFLNTLLTTIINVFKKNFTQIFQKDLCCYEDRSRDIFKTPVFERKISRFQFNFSHGDIFVNY